MLHLCKKQNPIRCKVEILQNAAKHGHSVLPGAALLEGICADPLCGVLLPGKHIGHLCLSPSFFCLSSCHGVEMAREQNLATAFWVGLASEHVCMGVGFPWWSWSMALNFCWSAVSSSHCSNGHLHTQNMTSQNVCVCVCVYTRTHVETTSLLDACLLKRPSVTFVTTANIPCALVLCKPPFSMFPGTQGDVDIWWSSETSSLRQKKHIQGSSALSYLCWSGFLLAGCRNQLWII
jgi:hypothetical protein